MTTTRAFVSALLISAIAACGGGGGSGGGGGGVTPSGTTVSVTLVGATPTAVAVASGTTGSFTPITLSSGNTFNVVVPAGTTTYRVAVACPPLLVMGTLIQETVYEAAIGDGTAFSVEPCFAFPTASATITGAFDVSAIPGATQAWIIAASGSASVSATSGTFSFATTSGTNDVAVEARDATSKLLAVKIVRAQSAPGAANGGATIALSAADTLVSTAVTINAIPAGYSLTPALNPSFITANGTRLNLPSVSPSQYSSVASADTIATDYYQVNTNDSPGNGNLIGTTVSSAAAVTALTNPAPLTYAGPTAAAWPSFALSYSGYTGLAAINYFGQISWPIGVSTQDEIAVYATPAFLGATTTVVMPDLSALSGFFNHPVTGTTINWLVEVNGGTFQSWMPTPPSVGVTNFTQARGTYLEP
jgi:hypothetical protein